MYRFVTCRGCMTHLPVGCDWEGTEVKCGYCGNVQLIQSATNRSEIDE